MGQIPRCGNPRTWFVESSGTLIRFDVYLNARSRTEPIIPLGILSMPIQAAIVAYLYLRFSREGSPAKEGLKIWIAYWGLHGQLRGLG